MNTITKIKERWPLDVMCDRVGIDIPKVGKFSSPFRPDKNPSCEVYRDGIKDWSTNEYFDSIGIFASAMKITNRDAIKILKRELSGVATQQKTGKGKLIIPALHYSPEEAEALATLRGLTRYGIDLAAETIQSLGFGEALGHRCWILTDGRNIAEARRMDGKRFPAYGTLGERKSHTIAGSKKSFPIGLNPRIGAKALQKLPVLLVEGGPDYLAACSVLLHSDKEMLPVAMLGSSSSINTLSLPFFKGRHVLILAHPDDAGVKASKQWARQLNQAGASPTLKQLEGGDLNDLVLRHGVEAIAKEIK